MDTLPPPTWTGQGRIEHERTVDEDEEKEEEEEEEEEETLINFFLSVYLLPREHQPSLNFFSS